MDTRSFTWLTDPLHFQLPPTKNLRASTLEVDVKARVACLAALVAILVAVLESIVVI